MNRREEGMTRIARLSLFVVLLLGLLAPAASAASGHFVNSGNNAAKCTDIGTQVECSGKVAGLGGTTFEITIEADGIASVVCKNPAGHRAPGQDTAVTVEGSTDPLPTPRNGQFLFSLTTDDPDPLPPTPTCPNAKWTPEIVDVTFTTATLSLYEDGVLTDQIVVAVS
jgi:hypothetical protein